MRDKNDWGTHIPERCAAAPTKVLSVVLVPSIQSGAPNSGHSLVSVAGVARPPSGSLDPSTCTRDPPPDGLRSRLTEDLPRWNTVKSTGWTQNQERRPGRYVLDFVAVPPLPHMGGKRKSTTGKPISARRREALPRPVSEQLKAARKAIQVRIRRSRRFPDTPVDDDDDIVREDYASHTADVYNAARESTQARPLRSTRLLDSPVDGDEHKMREDYAPDMAAVYNNVFASGGSPVLGVSSTSAKLASPTMLSGSPPRSQPRQIPHESPIAVSSMPSTPPTSQSSHLSSPTPTDLTSAWLSESTNEPQSLSSPLSASPTVVPDRGSPIAATSKPSTPLALPRRHPPRPVTEVPTPVHPSRHINELPYPSLPAPATPTAILGCIAVNRGSHPAVETVSHENLKAAVRDAVEACMRHEADCMRSVVEDTVHRELETTVLSKIAAAIQSEVETSIRSHFDAALQHEVHVATSHKVDVIRSELEAELRPWMAEVGHRCLGMVRSEFQTSVRHGIEEMVLQRQSGDNEIGGMPGQVPLPSRMNRMQAHIVHSTGSDAVHPVQRMGTPRGAPGHNPCHRPGGPSIPFPKNNHPRYRQQKPYERNPQRPSRFGHGSCGPYEGRQHRGHYHEQLRHGGRRAGFALTPPNKPRTPSPTRTIPPSTERALPQASAPLPPPEDSVASTQQRSTPLENDGPEYWEDYYGSEDD
ncbi:hypothetical protein OBBRIDRAFT_800446 [Obba rivulosa]|uniref:Uncharacterized protein n=1 Tax=Obba rivulosa TaxID=1052685 RepID=A0A8E2DTU1_9APHY|nr:hypothetical protein OBBRIDRAFT_800446 [Obba rivulosa]